MTKPLLDFTDLAFRRGKRLLMFQFQFHLRLPCLLVCGWHRSVRPHEASM